MKTAVVVGLFVLVAYVQLQTDALECSGEPAGGWNACQLSRCNEETGQYTIQRCADVVGIPHCTGRSTRVWIEQDLTQSFPECCARYVCREQ